MLHLAEKAFWPARLPVPGHARRHRPQLRRGHRLPRPPRRRARRPARRRVGAGVDRRRPGRRGDRARGQPQPAADGHAARRDRGARLRRRVRRRPARRGEGPGQGARLLLPRRVRPVGPEEPAARAVEPLQRPPPQGRAHPGVPAVELDRARHLAVHRRRGDRAAVDLLRAPPRGVPARRHAARGHRLPARRRTARRSFEDDGALPHGRRRDLHRRGRVDGARPSTR